MDVWMCGQGEVTILCQHNRIIMQQPSWLIENCMGGRVRWSVIHTVWGSHP